jgi:transposase InsO family protein
MPGLAPADTPPRSAQPAGGACRRARTFKAELIDRFTWHTRAKVRGHVTRWIGWYNNDRIHTSVGDIPPAEYEAAYYSATITPKAA